MIRAVNLLVVVGLICTSALAQPAPGGSLAYSTLLGGSVFDQVRDVAVTSSGIYVTGSTRASPLPLPGGTAPANKGSSDVYVLRLDRTGTRIEASFFFGGSSSDEPRSIRVTNLGGIYVTGFTGSPDFPVTPRAAQSKLAGSGDAFVVKIDPELKRILYATYFGGSDMDYVDGGLAIDPDGQAIFAGRTQSRDLPTTPGAVQPKLRGQQNGYLAKLDGDGTRVVFATYFGGGGYSEVTDVDVDATRNIFFVGSTDGSDLPVTACPLQRRRKGENDGFVAKLDQDGKLLYATYLGGRGPDRLTAIRADGTGRAYVAGALTLQDVRLPSGGHRATSPQDTSAFVGLLSINGSRLLRAATLGGSGADGVSELTIDDGLNLVLVGETTSKDLSTTEGAVSSTYGGPEGYTDVFVAQLDATWSNLTYATYLGGPHEDNVYGAALDGAGHAYIVGRTLSKQFPVTKDALLQKSPYDQPGYLAKISVGHPRVTAAPIAEPPETPGRCAAELPELKVAMAGNYLPLHGTKDGQLVGYEVDLALAIGEVLGREVVFLDRAALKGLPTIDAVRKGVADVALSAITPTAERKKKVDFTRPYVELKVRLAAPYGSDPRSFTQLAGKRIALVDGPWSKEVLPKLTGMIVMLVKSSEAALTLLDEGKVDLVAGEDVGLLAASGGAGLTFLPNPLANSPIAMAVPKKKAKLYDPVIAKLSQKRAELAKKWELDFDSQDLVAGVKPLESGRIYIGVCEGGTVAAFAVFTPRPGGIASLRGDAGESAPSEAEWAEIEASRWFHVRPSGVRPVRWAMCRGAEGFLVSQPVVLERPPTREGDKRLWAKVPATGVYLTGGPYEDIQTCSYTDSEGTYDCGERGYTAGAFWSGREEHVHYRTEKWGD